MTEAPPVYLDHAATTPVDPAVVEVMMRWLSGADAMGNPSSRGHCYGRGAAAAVEKARQQVAALVGAEPEGIVWTSGATEANNLALLGAVRFAMKRGRGRHLVSCRTEHKAVLEACAALEREGAEVTLLDPAPDGSLCPGRVLDAVRDDTVLVSLMHVNNETGVIHDIAAIADTLRSCPVLFHVDAAQSAGRLPLAVADWGVDMVSLSAHKLYGPKGVGALYVRPRPRLRIEPLAYGGGQERGMRPGTLATHQIAGMGLACALAAERIDTDSAHLLAMRRRLWDRLSEAGGVVLHGRWDGAPHILNVGFQGVHGEALETELEDAVAISTGSACASADATPSHVLRAMGVPDTLVISSFRFSLGRTTRAEDVDRVARSVLQGLRRLRSFSAVRGEEGGEIGTEARQGNAAVSAGSKVLQ
ncbi:MAG: aminotransferase class V-fold PLP-dependent enzyme [Ectothiorhodospiraceae bacterium]|nr:aminotransferase class V-fold PLP-dependent enzyme [Ectothiorhodospiraceae bacterium]MCH8507127.1 aminotransferase class V-fold PLP-dependent enzyme [Ectothiorhodospiraceae bacterium]